MTEPRWTEKLQPGDTVIYVDHYDREFFATVKSRSPKLGLISLNKTNARFDNCGREIRSAGSFSFSSIREATPEAKARVREATLLRRAKQGFFGRCEALKNHDKRITFRHVKQINKINELLHSLLQELES